ncbi:MAG: phosphoribosyl-ATP diphosphatase [Clostridiales Family XIII bacterium]|jgi:phosphoribosyl-ATP pyrophosphohydrolase|nr:phosphoribosyl-ATP diphosphatase [Clostridiales Family XIII bacterium]
MSDLLRDLFGIVTARRAEGAEGSYTAYLFEAGLDKILKKLGEECSETIIAAKNLETAFEACAEGPDETVEELAAANEALVGEIGDLLYHLTVMMAQCGIDAEAVEAVLRARMEKTGNLKQSRATDRNT